VSASDATFIRHILPARRPARGSAGSFLANPMIRFESVDANSAPARSLLGAMRDEMAALYDDLDIDASNMPAAGPAQFAPPKGDFLVGIDAGGDGICCGGIKPLPDGACEFKRLYVRPEARRRGVARELLARLEDRARELGFEVARLDTGPRQPQSERLFRSAGYRPIGDFNDNPVASFFGEKLL
jgi:GNAT superfamily N-acetyltransferase